MLCYHNLFTNYIPLTTKCDYSFLHYIKTVLRLSMGLANHSSSLQSTTTNNFAVITNSVCPICTSSFHDTIILTFRRVFPWQAIYTLIPFLTIQLGKIFTHNNYTISFSNKHHLERQLCTIQRSDFDFISFDHSNGQRLYQNVLLYPPMQRRQELFRFIFNNTGPVASSSCCVSIL